MSIVMTKSLIGQRIGKGIECIVHDYMNNKVIKIYYNCESAKYAIHYGRIAFENGIGPEVFSDRIFEYPIYNDYKYAIICEHVKTTDYSDFNNRNPYDDKRYYSLCKKCRVIFGNDKDLHMGNMGWSKDGTLIKIDFGPCST